MKELQIRAEHQPSRCEVCHQADCFDAEQNFCSRCHDLPHLEQQRAMQIIETEVAIARSRQQTRQQIIHGWIFTGMKGGALGGGLVMTFIGILGSLQKANAFEIFMSLLNSICFGVIFFGLLGFTAGLFIGSLKSANQSYQPDKERE
jgi:hypothetical protein